ncbi:H-NS family nucleoid-associated regulatory protein [Yoonia sp. R2-816]|uniref:H-NS histone family protein n=1 Tax=Yoonia sp. R2-816 TaxID=3342638 RepID=UPI0037275033
MKLDLKSMSRKELERLRTHIDKALQKLIGSEKKAVKMHGFSLTEIVDTTPMAEPKTKFAPKYADPTDKTKTWTGRGKPPDWFKAALKSGKTPDDLAV